MMRAILSLLLSTFLATLAGAQVFPEIPNSSRILTLEEVRNYWVNHLQEPTQPSRLDKGYQHLIVSYHREVGERHRLIQAIRSGKFDGRAKIEMLRHNIFAYRAKGDDDMVLKLGEELFELEAIAEREENERANADRLERLIAATERLAAAIEKNGGKIPADAEEIVDEIIPFERDDDDRRSIVSHLHDEIEICRQPIYVVDHNNHPHPHLHPTPTSKPAKVKIKLDRPTVVTPPRPQHQQQPTVRQPQVRPVPTPRQPQVRPVPAPRQPQVRPAR